MFPPDEGEIKKNLLKRIKTSGTISSPGEKKRKLTHAEGLQFLKWYYDEVSTLYKKEIRQCKSRAEKGDKLAVHEALQNICTVYEAMSGENIEWLENKINEIFDKKAKKKNEQEDIGRLVDELVYFGSSQNQAIPSVADWLGHSDTKVRDAYYQSKGSFYLEGRRADIMLFNSQLSKAIEGKIIRKPFPCDYPKAYSAFVNAGLTIFEVQAPPPFFRPQTDKLNDVIEYYDSELAANPDLYLRFQVFKHFISVDKTKKFSQS